MKALKKSTVVFGASPNPSRYSYIATTRLQNAGHVVFPLGVRPGSINGTEIITGRPPLENVGTVTLYVNPALQKESYSYILGLQPERIIFNPGTENPELEELATTKGIKTQRACTLVLLSTNQY